MRLQSVLLLGVLLTVLFPGALADEDPEPRVKLFENQPCDPIHVLWGGEPVHYSHDCTEDWLYYLTHPEEWEGN